MLYAYHYGVSGSSIGWSSRCFQRDSTSASWTEHLVKSGWLIWAWSEGWSAGDCWSRKGRLN